jgi:methylated-DNA-[protein]-cysteine S-methyltransferase
MMTAYRFLSSPFGKILVAWSDRGLVRVGIREDSESAVEPGWRFDPKLECDATRQLEEYFGGERRAFQLPLYMDVSEFRRRVYAELENIPFGETVAYGEVAQRVGNPLASRAVGLACGSNPLPIVVPCHRVIGKSGKLVGFGGGLEMKQAMLEFERSLTSARVGPLGIPLAARIETSPAAILPQK